MGHQDGHHPQINAEDGSNHRFDTGEEPEHRFQLLKGRALYIVRTTIFHCPLYPELFLVIRIPAISGNDCQSSPKKPEYVK